MDFSDDYRERIATLAQAGRTRVRGDIDASDPDNLMLAIAAANKHGSENVAVVLTGRCAMSPEEIARRLADGERAGLSPKEAVPISEWNREYSELLKLVSAVRIVKLLSLFGYHDIPIFNGGFAEAPRIQH